MRICSYGTCSVFVGQLIEQRGFLKRDLFDNCICERSKRLSERLSEQRSGQNGRASNPGRL